MPKLWAGRTDGMTSKAADDFNSSIHIDGRMYKEDIEGSIAHAKMLGRQGIIDPEEAEQLIEGLEQIRDDIDSGKLRIDPEAEDIHMFVEQVLTDRIGSVGKKLHTARSRNDQVALDARLYLKKEEDEIAALLKKIITALTDKAEEYKAAVMPGYTHLQRAQPITFGHQLMAYAEMFLRDIGRVNDAKKRTDVSPIGSCALAGTTYPTDRFFEAEQLGIRDVCRNSLDGVSDRDFCLELASALAIIMTHLSRLSEELVLWSSWEFRFITLSDSYTTGSSIMPQKKNPDMAELTRGKTGRVYGNLITLLTLMKGLPLAYNKDMQEDKEHIFDACDTVKECLNITYEMIRTLKADPERMRRAAGEGFINATDLADYLVAKGLPFREAYKISGGLVSECVKAGVTLEQLPLEKYQAACPLIGDDVYGAIDLDACVSRRQSFGGTSVESVERQIAEMRKLADC